VLVEGQANLLGECSPMNRTKSRERRSMPKRSGPVKTVDAYLARIPQPARGTLQKVRATIRSAVPPGTTEVISYGIPAFKYKGPLVWYAAFAKHCSFFPTARVIEAFKNELKGFATSKGTIQFPVDKPLPATLVKAMVKARLADQEKKKA
jgi:uncharacterized protein YdhG (YjbR/CyaY superfamily)